MSVNDSEMTLENFNRVLSPLRRQHPIKSFRGHSTVIPLHFKHELRLQSQMSVNDSEMTLEKFNRVLSPLRRQHPIKVF